MEATPSPVLKSRAIRLDASPSAGQDANQGSLEWQDIQGSADLDAQRGHIADIEAQIERLKQVHFQCFPFNVLTVQCALTI